jgi:ABC-type Fe3+/spermidine/putrescine transport system ATPase subunit
MGMSTFLEVQSLSKRFGELVVLDDVSLDVEEGEVLALLGPSGSGKTTFLRLLAGFETPDGGSIRAGGRAVEGLPPAKRGFGMVFQHYALFPHLSVCENVAFGLESAARGERPSKAEAAERVARVLALVDLTGFEARRIEQLSGGQQQRVALARALAPRPKLLLLDEPLSNLDPDLRERTRRELLEAIRQVGITTVLVTHEQEEAFHLGDRVAVLWNGRLQQVGSPEELYLAPANRFVTRFIGRSTALAGTVEGAAGDGRVRVRLAAGPDPERAPTWEGVATDGEAAPEPGAPVELIVRPEALRLERAAGAADSPGGGLADVLAGRVVARRYGGPVTYYRVAVDEPGGEAPVEVEVLAPSGAAAEGDAVRVFQLAQGPPARVFSRAPPARVFRQPERPA